ncbi:MAG: hypothetical protein ACREEM_48205, partial [Blastocatellia bacterium]
MAEILAAVEGEVPTPARADGASEPAVNWDGLRKSCCIPTLPVIYSALPHVNTIQQYQSSDCPAQETMAMQITREVATGQKG